MILVYGFGSSIRLTRYFASSETLGQGSLVKSTLPRIIACAMASSVSVLNNKQTHKLYENGTFNSIFLRNHACTYTQENIKKGLTCPKGWHTAKQNIKNNACAPDINLLSIVSSQNFRSHVIRTSNNFIESIACHNHIVNSYFILVLQRKKDSKQY